MKSRIFIYILIIILFSSCENFLEENPKDFLSPENLPTTEEDCLLMLNGAIGKQRSWLLYDRCLFYLAGVSADDFYEIRSSGEAFEIEAYTYQTTSSYIKYTWYQCYRIINETNLMIQKIPDTDLDDTVIEQYVASAKYLRAFIYFHLVRLYGDNAVLLEEPIEDFELASQVVTSPIEDFYDLILSDIEYAVGKNSNGENRLSEDEYPEQGSPTFGAAKALQSKIYLTVASQPLERTEYWEKAKDVALEVMNMSKYALSQDVENLFLIENETNSEFIYSIQYLLPDYGSMMAVQSRPDGWNLFHTSYDYFNKYFSDTTDLRRKSSFILEWNGKTYEELNSTRMYVKKYSDIGREVLTNYNKRSALNIPVFRMGEVYLIYAEAENEANGPTASAYDAINATRERAGLQSLAGLSKDQFREELKLERNRELCFELKRRYDLQRWGDLEEIMKDVPKAAPNFDITEHLYYPTPDYDVLLNENLK